METIESNIELIEKKQFKHATLFVVKTNEQIAVVRATSTYIPIDQFKDIFNFITELTREEHITKLIFDKRNLTVFHQPSMEWYFTEWKEIASDLGLVVHRKILPNDEIFRQSVKIGREKINNTFPNGKYKLLDIAYADSLEEAISQ
jgi:hypothetical protein